MAFYFLQEERGCKMERVWSTVCLLSPIRWKTILVQRSLFSLVIWIASAAEAIMKSALNPFPVCHFLLDNMMDGPFYSLFHPLCCSKLYFQGAFTWNIHFCVTWLFIREEVQMHQGFQEGGERGMNPTTAESSSYFSVSSCPPKMHLICRYLVPSAVYCTWL